MTYDEMYDVFCGIYNTFDKSSPKKLLSVNHGRKKRDDMKPMFPYRHYESYSKSVFILASLYVNFKKMPSSLSSAVEELQNVTMLDIQLFKDNIVQYRKYLQDDIQNLITEFGTNISFEQITETYRNGNIQWYTWYFYLTVSGYDLEKLEKSRINGILYKRIKTLLMFVSFSQDSMLLTKKLMTNNLSFS